MPFGILARAARRREQPETWSCFPAVQVRAALSVIYREPEGTSQRLTQAFVGWVMLFTRLRQLVVRARPRLGAFFSLFSPRKAVTPRCCATLRCQPRPAGAIHR